MYLASNQDTKFILCFWIEKIRVVEVEGMFRIIYTDRRSVKH